MSLESQLSTRLGDGRVVILGVGDVKMRDDGVGPYVVSAIHEQVPEIANVMLVNGSTVPEFYRQEIAEFHPDHIAIIDAADMKEAPGTLSIVENTQMRAFLPVSSHGLPLTLTIDWILNELPGTDIFLLGVQPESIGIVDDDLELAGYDEEFLNEVEEDPLKPFFRFTLTPPVKDAAEKLTQMLMQILEQR
ncbi:MAG TPA: hydrogenase maturation protease [Candidatus Lokiarchaeia archaeon]|nr:hydrogenase maturation protease [Candidatus Lokiarchaeia archaeon]